MAKETLWCSVRWWLLILEPQLPFFPLDLLHVPDPGARHSIPDHPQAETFLNGIVQRLVNWGPGKRKEIKPQAIEI